jgi:predicted phage baseplate assembly protein
VRSALPDELRLQVGWLADDGRTMIWYDWRRVDDFDESDADSFHYVVDEEEEAIRFSDGICGAVPPAMPTDNIRIIGCRTGVGAAGNVKEDTIKEVELYEQSLQVTNLYPAYGGMEAETVKEALQRAALSVLEPQCGITGADLERRVREIPGLRIARVKAIPGYHPGIREYPEERDFGHISIVVVPRSRNPLPKPSEGMIETIRRHLEPYRLLTVKLHVIPPEYVRISVRAVVVVDPRYEGREWTVRQALEEWLQAFDGETGAGWEFGRTVYKSDVYDIIHRVPGVRYIQDVWITGVGRGAVQEEGGDIRIPPNGLAISGEHEIEFLTG